MLNLRLAVEAARQNRDEEAITLVTQQARVGEPSYLARIRTGSAVAQIAMQLAENREYFRAVAFVEHTLRIHQEVSTDLESDEITRLRALSTEAFLFYHVLHDYSRAYSAYKQCLSLQPSNERYQAMVAKLQPSADAARVYSSVTPLINRAYGQNVQGPSLEISGDSLTGYQIDVRGTFDGIYRVEQSADLISWTLLYKTSSVSVPLNPHQMTNQAMFFRVVPEANVPADSETNPR